jgi:putative two-component system response regulator
VNNKNRNAVILAVDDAPENLDIVRNLLASRYTVKAAVNGPMALKIAAKQPPDLILLDIQMPGMDGYEVCRRLKTDPATSAIPVIFLTGENGVESEVAAAGGSDYVTKPVDPGVLLSTLEKYLADGNS